FSLPEKMEKSTIKKTSRIKEKLRAYLEANVLKTRINPTTQEEETRKEGGLTPSYINTFLENPKKFALKKILDIKDADEIEEWLEVNTFGTLIHGYLEEIILEQDLLNKPLTDKDIEKILKDNKALQEHLDKLLANHAGQVVSKRGKNYLLKRIAGLLLEKFVKMQLSEKEKVAIVLAVEKELQTTIPVVVNNQEILVVLKGNADRIDVQGEKVRVVDYKTGKHDDNALKAKNLDELLTDTKKEKVIQLMIYRYLLLKELNNEDSELRKHLPEKLKEKIAQDGGLSKDDIQAGFIFFRSLGKSGFVEYSLGLEKTPKFPTESKGKTSKKSTKPNQAGEDDLQEASRLNAPPKNNFNLEQFVEEFITAVVTKMFEGEEFTEETPFAEEDEENNEDN
ncbi:MAG: PD-(D/E)XK nuclease family protein, partial [Thermoflexibacteraceae bacterium]